MANKYNLLKKIQTTSRFLRTNLAQDLHKEGLYPGQDNVLLLLSANGELSLGQLAKELDVRPPTITKTILRLTNQGFVQKTTSPLDQRQSFVSLTEKGMEAANNLKSHIDTIEKNAFSGLNSDEVDVLVTLLQRIENNLSY